MDFKVNWDSSVWATTTIVTALLFCVSAMACVLAGGVWGWLVAVVFIGIGVVCASMAPVKVRITSNGITLFKIIGSKRFPYSAIQDISLIDLGAGVNVRLFGSGGFFGYTGWFYNKRIGRYMAYIGSMPRTVLITLDNDKKYIISCRQPDRMVEISRSNLRKIKSNLNIKSR